jgi:hypothetical protein
MQNYTVPEYFASTAFTEIAFFTYGCDYDGNCLAFGSNTGQFALDNIGMEVSAVPEPGTWMMLLGGLGTVAALRRRAV